MASGGRPFLGGAAAPMSTTTGGHILVLCCLLLGAVVLLQAAVAKRRRHRDGVLTCGDLPGGLELPCLGHLPQLFWRGGPAQLVPLMDEWAERYGPRFRFTTVVPGIAVTDAEDVMTVLKGRSSAFKREKVASSIFKAQSGWGGLFTAEGEQWKRQRRLVSPHFNRPNARQMVQGFCEVAERLRDKWQQYAADGSAFSVVDDLHLFALDVNYVAVTGRDVNALGGASVGRDALFTSHAVEKAVRSPLYLLQHGGEIKASIARSQAFVASIVDAAMQEQRVATGDTQSAPHSTTANVGGMTESGGGDTDSSDACGGVLRAAVMAVQPGGADDCSTAAAEARADLVDSIGLMLFAGFDTVGTAFGWALYHIAASLSMQRRIRQEVAAVAGGRGDSEAEQIIHDADATVTYTWQQVDQLHFLDAVIRETLRLHPPVPMIPVQAVQDTTVAGVSVPAGTVVYALLRHAPRSEAHFTRALDFWPERWLIASGAAPAPEGFRHGNVVTAFGYGLRNCPGQLAAFAQLKVVLATLVSSYSITLAPEQGQPKARLWNSTSPEELNLVLQPAVSA